MADDANIGNLGVPELDELIQVELKWQAAHLPEEKVKELWYFDEKGKKKLSHLNLAYSIIEDYGLIYFGNERPSFYVYENGFYKRCPEIKIQQYIEDEIEGKIRTNDINEVIGHIKRILHRSQTNFEKIPPNFICIKNGILDIITLKLYPHTPNLIFTQQIDIEYVPGADCPLFKKFISEILSPEDAQLIKEFMGFLLYRQYFIKKAFICVGQADSGKTTLIKALTKFIGQENTCSISLHSISQDKFASIDMQYKLLNIFDDLSFQDIKATGNFKIATGDGWVAAEHKFGERTKFQNYAKMCFATNKISDVSDPEDDAYYGRWIIIPFHNEFKGKKRDYNLLQKITTKEELQGMLNFALDGLKQLLENSQFSYNKDEEQNKLIMQRSANSIAAFVQDCLQEDIGKWISKNDLYKLYTEYIKLTGGACVSMDMFGKKLPKLATYIRDAKMDTKKQKRCHGWINIAIKITPKNKDENEDENGPGCPTFSDITYIYFTKTNDLPIHIEKSSFNFQKYDIKKERTGRTLKEFEKKEEKPAKPQKTTIHLRCNRCGEEPSHFFEIGNGGNPICENCAKASELKVREPEADEI